MRPGSRSLPAGQQHRNAFSRAQNAPQLSRALLCRHLPVADVYARLSVLIAPYVRRLPPLLTDEQLLAGCLLVTTDGAAAGEDDVLGEAGARRAGGGGSAGGISITGSAADVGPSASRPLTRVDTARTASGAQGKRGAYGLREYVGLGG